MANSAADEAGDYDSEIITEFRANQGRVGGMWEGTTLILLHHVGARSGIERVTPVACSPQPAGRFAICAANGGSPATRTGITTSRPMARMQCAHAAYWERHPRL